MTEIPEDMKNVLNKKDKEATGLIIHFASPGSARFDVFPQGEVFPEQLLALGSFFEWKGKQMMQIEEVRRMQMQQQKQEIGKIKIPGRD